MSQRVLIIRNAYQKDTGGAEQYAFNLAKALKNAGMVPFVVTKHKAIHEKCHVEGIKTIRGVWYEKQEWDRKYYLRFLYTTLWYIWIILTRRIDVVHPQSRDDFVFATDAARICRKKVIWTDHADLKYIMDRVNHPHPRMQAWIADAARYVSNIICVSHSEKQSISTVAPEFKEKLVIIHNGVFVPKNVVPVDKKHFVIGTNARLVPEKGIGELIEAFAKLKNIDSELWLLGGLSGNKNMYQDQAKKLGVSNRVRFLGYVKNPNDYVAAMDIFVHASYHEAFSLAIIEACMLGRPIIATAVGGTPEIITKNTGILIQPKNVKELHAALALLIENPEKATALGMAAQELAHKSFDFQTLVDKKLIPLYEGVTV